MKMRTLIAATTATCLSTGIAAADQNSDRTKIETVLSTYEKALNASDADTIMTLYTEDGVFMAQHHTPNVGKEAVRVAYDGVFETIKLDVDFTVDEILQLSPKWAYACTQPEGFVTANATGDKGPEANQELFIFHQKDNGEWKIAQYIFSTTNPPRQ